MTDIRVSSIVDMMNALPDNPSESSSEDVRLYYAMVSQLIALLSAQDTNTIVTAEPFIFLRFADILTRTATSKDLLSLIKSDKNKTVYSFVMNSIVDNVPSRIAQMQASVDSLSKK